MVGLYDKSQVTLNVQKRSEGIATDMTIFTTNAIPS